MDYQKYENKRRKHRYRLSKIHYNSKPPRIPERREKILHLNRCSNRASAAQKKESRLKNKRKTENHFGWPIENHKIDQSRDHARQLLDFLFFFSPSKSHQRVNRTGRASRPYPRARGRKRETDARGGQQKRHGRFACDARARVTLTARTLDASKLRMCIHILYMERFL